MPYEVKWRQVKYHKEIYLFLVPTVILIGLFIYYPAASGIFHSFFRWNGADIKEFLWFRNYTQLWRMPEFWQSFKVAIMLGVFNVLKMTVAIATSVCIHRCISARIQFFYRLMFVIPMVIPGLIVVLVWRTLFFEATRGFLNQFLLANDGFLLNSLCRLDALFGWGGVFQPGVLPAWLGHPQLIVASCILWGFPWVGTFAVLTTLAKLQGISKDVYEAAEIDGIGWFSKFVKIELPLIMGSMYILLVLMIIDTIKDAGMILALAGMEGGPGGKATVPALFMLRQAFLNQNFGLACAIGIVLTAVVMFLQKSLTWIMTPQEVYASWKAKFRRLCMKTIMRLPLFYLVVFATGFVFTNIPLSKNFASIPTSAKHEWVAADEEGKYAVNVTLRETAKSTPPETIKAGRNVVVNITREKVESTPSDPGAAERKIPQWTVNRYVPEDKLFIGSLDALFDSFQKAHNPSPALMDAWKAEARKKAAEGELKTLGQLNALLDSFTGELITDPTLLEKLKAGATKIPVEKSLASIAAFNAFLENFKAKNAADSALVDKWIADAPKKAADGKLQKVALLGAYFDTFKSENMADTNLLAKAKSEAKATLSDSTLAAIGNFYAFFDDFRVKHKVDFALVEKWKEEIRKGTAAGELKTASQLDALFDSFKETLLANPALVKNFKDNAKVSVAKKNLTTVGRLKAFFGISEEEVKKNPNELVYIGAFRGKFRQDAEMVKKWKADAKEAANTADRAAERAIGTTYEGISFAKQFKIDAGGYLDDLMWILWCVGIGLIIELVFRFASNQVALARMRYNEKHFDKDAAYKRLSNPWIQGYRFVMNCWLRTLKHAFIWLVLFFAFLPLFLMLIVSFKTNQQFYASPTVPTLPLHPENWVEAWKLVMPSVSNSIFISTLVTGFSLMFALCSAYFFARQKMPMSGFIWNAILILMMMPMIANLVPLFRLLRDLNLINTLSALILVGCAGGQVFAIFVLRTFVQEIPRDLYEAAEIDGASHFAQLWRIVIPLSGPIMGTVGVQLFIGAWNEFIMPLIILRDAARLPVMVQILRMNGEYVKIWGPLMAGYALTAIPIILLFIFSMKLFVRGLTEGAVKG